MSASGRSRWRVGNVVRIALAPDEFAYAWTLEEPLVAFFDFREVAPDTPTSIEDLTRKPIAFRILVMSSALTRGRWPVVGLSAPPAEVADHPWFFKQDILTGVLTKTLTGEEEVPIDASACEQLEAAAVWEAEHVEDRLRDHFAGRQNKWCESLRPDLDRVPHR